MNSTTIYNYKGYTFYIVSFAGCTYIRNNSEKGLLLCKLDCIFFKDYFFVRKRLEELFDVILNYFFNA